MTDYRDFYRELRTDWLKLRGCLFDPITLLPTLPKLLDSVRRRLEARESVGLIYLDTSGGGHLEAAHGWQAYDQILRQTAETLRKSPSLEGEAKESLAMVGVRSDELVLFPRLERAPDEQEEELDRLRAWLVAEVEAELREMTLWAPLRSSAVVLRMEPTIRIERSIYLALQRARDLCRQESERRRSGRLAELHRMLRARDVVVRYQPIVDLRDGRVHGFEALSQASAGSCFENSDMLFSFAEENGRILDLDRLCRSAAIERCLPLLGASGRAAGCKLFLNCSASVFQDESLLSDLASSMQATGLGPETLVLEVTERVAITEWQEFRESLAKLREAGVLVAIDDMGSGYSSLRSVAEIEPDYLKFDLSLVSDIHASPIKRELLSALVTLARKIDALPIAEGIEKEEEFETLREMGVDYGQGFFFARPASPAETGPVHFPEAARN